MLLHQGPAETIAYQSSWQLYGNFHTYACYMFENTGVQTLFALAIQGSRCTHALSKMVLLMLIAEAAVQADLHMCSHPHLRSESTDCPAVATAHYASTRILEPRIEGLVRLPRKAPAVVFPQLQRSLVACVQNVTGSCRLSSVVEE